MLVINSPQQPGQGRPVSQQGLLWASESSCKSDFKLTLNLPVKLPVLRLQVAGDFKFELASEAASRGETLAEQQIHSFKLLPSDPRLHTLTCILEQ